MPKVKTKKSAAKRFKIRSSGGIKRSQAYLRHILTKKSPKRKRNLRRNTTVGTNGEQKVLKRLLLAS